MKKKILLVEYATSSIETIKEILSHPLFDITTASEGDEAKKRLAEKQFDLMITAAMLPKFHGFSLSQYAAENYPGIKIIILSHIYKGVEYKHQAISQYRASDFFEIPFDKNVFKRRTLELLGIDEEELSLPADKSTIQVPVSDTRKIPTLKKMQEQERGDGLTSGELFGDIIQQVEKEPPPFEIKLNGVETREQRPSPHEPPVTRVLTGDRLPGELDNDIPATTQVLKQTGFSRGAGNDKSAPAPSAATQKINMDLFHLIQAGKKDKEKKENEKFKKIEDDISRKLEDTLSGLGISDKKTGGARKEKEPVKQPRTQTRIEIPDEADDIGGYEILGQIGRGGMAEVYKAKKKGLKGFEKIIALKKILSGYGEDDKYLEMFVDEAKIAAQLSHSNIVQIHDLGKKDDYYFIAMEYVPGKDLRVVLNKMARESVIMPEELSIYLVIKVLAALNYAHSAKDSGGKRLDIVHRDVSPPNILVSYNGNIKLTDFGVSKASIKMHQTLAGALKGKISYMSPEQAGGENDIDYRSDLYSVGIILFELITGKKLFLAPSEMATLKKVQAGEIIEPSRVKRGIEPELEAIILKALEKDIKKRYQKASDMIKDLDAYIMKHYDSMPESSHLSYFIYTLFKAEIGKEGIEVNIHAIPRPIKKIKREIEKEKETELPAAVEPGGPSAYETLEFPAEWAMPPAEEAAQGPDGEYPGPEAGMEAEELPGTGDFHPVIEIDLEGDGGKRPLLPLMDSLEQEKDSKKKRNLLLVLFLLLVILVIVIGVFLIDGLTGGKRESGPAEEPKPVEAQTPPPGQAEITAETGTGALSGEKEPRPQDPDKAGKDAGAPREQPKTRDRSQRESIEVVPPAKPAQIEKKEKKKEKEKKKPDQPDQPAAETEAVSKETREEPAAVPQEQKKDSESPAKVETPAEETAAPAPPAVKEGDILPERAVDTDAVPIPPQKIEISRGIKRLMLSDQRVFVTFLVDHNGNVEEVKIIKKSSLKKLDTLIVESVKQWKFKPAAKNNVKVKIWKSKWFVIKK